MANNTHTNGSSSGATKKRRLTIPDSLHLDIVEENVNSKRNGTKRNTEEEMLALLEDGIILRKLQRTKSIQEVAAILSAHGIKITPWT